MTAYTPSNAYIIQRIPASPGNVSHTINCDAVPVDVPCFVAFGGELTYCDRFANSYAKTLETALRENGITGQNIYSVVYEFGSLDSSLERANLFRKAGRKLTLSSHAKTNRNRENNLLIMNENEPTPNYVIQLYNILLRPRICDNQNKRIQCADAINRMGRIKFYAHCHGAVAIFQMANYMFGEMLNFGYTDDEIKQVMKSLLVVQHSPLAPLENAKFTTISFASAEDVMLNHHNNFTKYIFNNSADIVPSFFEEPMGNLMIAGKLKNTIAGEHDHLGLTKEFFVGKYLTDDGKLLFSAERNAIVRAAQHSVRGGKLPTAAELISDENIDFNQLKRSGDFISRIMLSDLRKQNPKHVHQK